MKRKIVVAIFLLGVSLMISINLTSAQRKIYFYAYTDKPYYQYGDQGTLFITARNNETGPIAIQTIVASFPWGPGWYHEQWIGDYTKEIPTEEQTINANTTKTYSLQFTVPSESRDKWGGGYGASITVKVTYAYGEEKPTSTITVPINVVLPVSNETITPIYYLTAVLTIAVIIAIIELYFVWKRLGKLTPVSSAV